MDDLYLSLSLEYPRVSYLIEHQLIVTSSLFFWIAFLKSIKALISFPPQTELVGGILKIAPL